MSVQIDVLRRESPAAEARWQSFLYDPGTPADTVATALTALNARPDLRDRNGAPAAPIRWEHSCLQKKCGACAMVICGRPGLACDARLSDYPGPIRLEPFRKFPVVADLLVDRSVMFDNLRTLEVWLEKAQVPREAAVETAYAASRCLQCGCCLEVCPNFAPGGSFFSAAGAAPMSRLLAQAPEDRAAAKRYRTFLYEGCGKSLSCHNVCPAGIDLEDLMVRSSAAAAWRGLFRNRKA